MTERDIQDKLRTKYHASSKYAVENVYFFADDWETDFLVIQNGSKYAYEFEIKISRADFKADAGKVNKHMVVRSGERVVKKFVRSSDIATKREHWRESCEYKEPTKIRPNRFYYVVPEKLITKEEVPDYAGLAYAGPQGIVIIKKAPLLHSEVIEHSSRLCNKMYYRWRTAEYNLSQMTRAKDRLIAELEKNNIKIPHMF